MKKQSVDVKCSMCHHRKFQVEVLDQENHMQDYNTQLICEHCGYEFPIELIFPISDEPIHDMVLQGKL